MRGASPSEALATLLELVQILGGPGDQALRDCHLKTCVLCETSNRFISKR